MALSTSALARNLSRFELGLAVLVIAILAALFMQRLDRVGAAAETAMVRTRVQDMQARLMALRASFASGRAADGATLRFADVERLLRRDEVPRVARSTGFDCAAMTPGDWVYLADRRRFVYRTIHDEVGQVTAHGPPQLRFQLQPIEAATRGEYGAAPRLLGARLVPLAPAEW